MQTNILSTGRPVHVIADCYLAKQIGHKSDTIEHCFYSRDIEQTPTVLADAEQSTVKLRQPARALRFAPSQTALRRLYRRTSPSLGLPFSVHFQVQCFYFDIIAK
jgi:hypothetical protein